MSVVGNCFLANYHHGNSSVENAISKLARPYGCSFPILNGDGFFGNSISNEAASPRYTSVSLNKEINEVISKYDFLNEKDAEGVYEPLHLEFPLGLLTNIIGIAVGYKTVILPRKMSDIIAFLKWKKEIRSTFFHWLYWNS
jgi:DNA topoisomerase-2